MAKSKKENPIVDPMEEQVTKLFKDFLNGLSTALNGDDVSEGTLKIALDFFKTQKVDFRDITKLLAAKGESFDLTAAKDLTGFNPPKGSNEG